MMKNKYFKVIYMVTGGMIILNTTLIFSFYRLMMML